VRGAAQLRGELCGFRELAPLEARLLDLASIPDDTGAVAIGRDVATA